MNWLWNCSGACFGYMDGDDLRTYSGKHAGRRFDKEIYDSRGNYLGEIVNLNTLMTSLDKQTWRVVRFTTAAKTPDVSRPQAASEGQPLYAGFKDFPSAESF